MASQSVTSNLFQSKDDQLLKELIDICGIQKNQSMHVARYTFATSVTLTNGVPLETVSKMLRQSICFSVASWV